MFLNFSNHNSSQWDDNQLHMAQKYGEIVDLCFPNVDPNYDESEISEIANNYLHKILSITGPDDMIMVQGEFTLTHLMVSMLISHNRIVVAACSERKVVESINELGKHEKRATFEFVKFRKYDQS